ncbi:MAG: copper homeostasis protein [Microbacteriaceae bacterium]|jgi:copper homeostasis protein|nr:copper homeostasis protein [Microbacteriaceae bacterium]
MGKRMLAVEIAVQDSHGARSALAEGADRIELCSALGVGGLTASAGTIEAVVDAARGAGRPGFVHVLIRPRPGGFVYSTDELDVMLREIRFARGAGAGGVVIGALDDAGGVDLEITRALLDAAGPLEVTFHRAADVAADPLATVDALASLGIRRVLTSGQAVRSIDGSPTLAAMVARAAGRIQIMAGGGVTVPDIEELAGLGVDAVHLSARRLVAGSASGPGGGDATYEATDAAVIRAAVAAARDR